MVQIHYGQFDEEAGRVVSGVLDGMHPIDVADLMENKKPPEYISFDGKGIDLNDYSKKFYRDGDYIGFVSKETSDELCNSGAGIYLYTESADDGIDLSQGLTFSFYGDCCREMHIQIMQNAVTVWEETIEVTSELVVIESLGDSCTGLIVTFTKTALPNQLLKLSYIKIGKATVFKKFKDIGLLEEIDVLSNDLPMNSLDFSVVLDEPIKFRDDDILNLFSNGKYYGTFYLESAERITNRIYSVRAYNCVKRLHQTQYSDYDFLNAPIEHFLNDPYQICETSGVVIKSNEDLNNYHVYGHIPIETCRFAVCALAFAGRLIVDGSRNDAVELKKLPDKVSSVITSAEKRIIGECTYKKRKLYSKATLYYPHYTDSEEFELVCDNVADEGYRAVFEEPTCIVEINAGNSIIDRSTLNYVDFTAKNEDATLKGYKYILVKKSMQTFNLNANRDKEIKFDNFTLMGKSEGITAADKCLDIQKYIQSEGDIKGKIRLRGERVGDLIQIETANDGIKTGIIKSMDISFGYEDVADIEVLEWSL